MRIGTKIDEVVQQRLGALRWGAADAFRREGENLLNLEVLGSFLFLHFYCPLDLASELPGQCTARHCKT